MSEPIREAAEAELEVWRLRILLEQAEVLLEDATRSQDSALSEAIQRRDPTAAARAIGASGAWGQMAADMAASAKSLREKVRAAEDRLPGG